MSRVLIVEDDTITRSILARVAGTTPGISALAVGSVQEAMAALDGARPDIAIIDLHLEDGLGFEVLKALDEKGGVMMAIIISAYLKEHERTLASSAGRLRCMSKPIDYVELKRALSAAVSGEARFHGPFSPLEYVQIAGSGKHSVKLSCFDPAGDRIGHVLIRDGRVWSAESVECTGLRALRDLIARDDARVRLEAPPEVPGPASIDRGWLPALEAAVTFECDEERAREQLARLYQFQRSVKP